SRNGLARAAMSLLVGRESLGQEVPCTAQALFARDRPGEAEKDSSHALMVHGDHFRHADLLGNGPAPDVASAVFGVFRSIGQMLLERVGIDEAKFTQCEPLPRKAASAFERVFHPCPRPKGTSRVGEIVYTSPRTEVPLRPGRLRTASGVVRL